MLDQLPPELVLAVLEHLAPPLDYPSRARVARINLYNLMRVSKRLYTLANPIFWREVAVESANEAVRLLAFLREGSAHDIKQHIETLQVSNTFRDSRPTVSQIQVLIALLPRAKRLELARVSEIQAGLSVLAEHDFEALWLCDLFLVAALPPARFTVLTELSLEGVDMAQGTLATFLTPEICPSLRALSLYEINSKFLNATVHDLSNRMFAQLDLLQLFLRDISPSSLPIPLLQSTTTPVVLIMDDGLLSLSKASAGAALHLAYFVSCSPRHEYGNKFSSVFTTSYQPRTLHSSVHLHPERLAALDPEPENHAALLEDVKTTLKICEERGVEVVWHEQDTTRLFAVSPSLWHWAKYEKVKLALEHGGGNGASMSG
ncbi:hypothetical protein JCM10207_007822 [Rhodosporidiobolus poonsookiae]